MDLRVAWCDETAPADPAAEAIGRFLELALGLRFEMRFISENRWWPAAVDDVGRGLAAYHYDLEHCLDRMLEGEILASRLSVYRIATTARTADRANFA